MSTPNEQDLAAENAELRDRLAEALDTLEAIRSGGVDALVTTGPRGEQVFTLQGAETPYRLLIEAMNEGAATVAGDGTVLYCNHRFAEMSGTPAEQIVGSCICKRFIPAQRSAVRSLVGGASHAGARAELTFDTPGGPGLPVQLSLRPIHADSDTIALVATDLSERNAHEERLRRLNEELEDRVRRRTAELQAIFDTAPIGLAIAEDPEGRQIRGNPAIEQALGLGRGDELSRGAPQPPPYRCLQDGHEVPPEQLPMQRAARGETVTGYLMDIERPDGTLITLHSNAVPLLDEEGRPCGSVGAFLDITGRKQAEQDLASQREELQLILDSCPAMIFYKDRDNHFLRVNRAFSESMGAPKEQLEGKSLFDLYPREQAEAYWRDDREVLASGRAKTGIVEPMPTPAGERWVHTGKVPCRDAQGNLTGVIGFALDVTGLKRAEEALRRSEELLRAVTDNSPDAIYVKDRQSRWLMANPAVLRIVGKAAQEALGKTDLKLYADPEIGRAILDHDRRILERGEAQAFEEVADTPQGRHTFLSIKAPRRDAQGQVIGLIGISRDVTDQKLAEAALRATNDELLRFNQAMVGRELRMVELKQEINELCGKLGQPPRYAPQTEPQSLETPKVR